MQKFRLMIVAAVLATLPALGGCDFLAGSDNAFAELSGVVMDQVNVPVAGVGLRRATSGTAYQISASDGRFVVGTFAEGAYDIEVSAPAGFQAPAGSSNVSSNGREWTVRVSNTSATAGTTVIRVQRL